MKKVLANSLFILLLVSLISCNNKQDNNVQNKDKPKHEELLKLRDNFEYVNFIPDSLRTPEQNALLLLIAKTIAKNTVVENKRFVFKLTREEIVALGIPEPYYEVMLNNAIEYNTFMDNATDSVSANFYKVWEKEKERLLKNLDSIEVSQTKVKR